jgi:hypothetical protein
MFDVIVRCPGLIQEIIILFLVCKKIRRPLPITHTLAYRSLMRLIAIITLLALAVGAATLPLERALLERSAFPLAEVRHMGLGTGRSSPTNGLANGRKSRNNIRVHGFKDANCT